MDFNIKQIKAGLALAGLDESSLAERIGMEQASISRIMTGKVSPREDTRRKIVRSIEDMGVEFIAGGGVLPRSSFMQELNGAEGWKNFSDERYQVALNSSRDFLSCGGTEAVFAAAAGKEYQQFHAARMRTIPNFKVRALKPLSDSTPQTVTYVEYRGIPDEQFPSVSFYVYGGNLAILRYEPEVKIFIIRDRQVSNGYRTLFEGLWANARPLRGNS